MKKTIILFMVFLLAAFYMGCEDNPTEPDNDVDYSIENFFPLSVGNEWAFENTVTDDIDSIKVVDDSTWNGKTVYKVQRIYPEVEYFLYSNNEVRRYDDFPTSSADYDVFLKEPIETGETWNFEEDEVEIIEIDATTDVSAELFTHCVQVRYNSGSAEGEGFDYAAGVGLVKFWEDGSYFELTDYHIE